MKWFLILVILVTSTAYSKDKYYVVEPGDTLSEIVFDLTGGPLVGQNNELQKVIQDNPHLKSPDLIYPGQKIYVKAYYGE